MTRDPIGQYWFARRLTNAVLGVWALLSLVGGVYALLTLVAGCTSMKGVIVYDRGGALMGRCVLTVWDRQHGAVVWRCR